MILIAPVSRVKALHNETGFSHAMSLLAPGSDFPVLDIAPERHLKLEFHDIVQDAEGHVSPGRTHMERILNFVQDWASTREAGLMIHCWAGISRSTASAYSAMCLLHPREDETALAAELRAASPEATPNIRLVRYADEIMGRNGRMVRAIEALGRGAEAFEGSVVRWQLKP